LVSVPVSTVQRGSIWKTISGLQNGTNCAAGSNNKEEMDSFAFWNRRIPFAGKAAFARGAANGNHGPTLKPPRCKLTFRDQRRTHCLSCLAVVFQGRSAEGVTKPSGAQGVTKSCAATAEVGAMPVTF
jgi:hypothetical protein